MTVLLRESLAEFAALRDNTSDRLGVTSGAIEKDYWATEVLRSACSHDRYVDGVVFKGGTSLSKAYHLIERFSEDVDLLVVTSAAGKALKRTLRAIADQVTVDTGVNHEREREGRGYLNARFEYPSMQDAPFLTSGVLLEMGSRGGPTPNEIQSVRSLMSEAAEEIDPSALDAFDDLTPFDATVLAPERTLAEKLAFLHHRATVGDLNGQRVLARHTGRRSLPRRSSSGVPAPHTHPRVIAEPGRDVVLDPHPSTPEHRRVRRHQRPRRRHRRLRQRLQHPSQALPMDLERHPTPPDGQLTCARDH